MQEWSSSVVHAGQRLKGQDVVIRVQPLCQCTPRSTSSKGAEHTPATHTSLTGTSNHCEMASTVTTPSKGSIMGISIKVDPNRLTKRRGSAPTAYPESRSSKTHVSVRAPEQPEHSELCFHKKILTKTNKTFLVVQFRKERHNQTNTHNQHVCLRGSLKCKVYVAHVGGEWRGTCMAHKGHEAGLSDQELADDLREATGVHAPQAQSQGAKRALHDLA